MYTHSDDYDACFINDVLRQFVEGGVGMVVEGLQLLYPIVQLDVGFKGLAQGAVYFWRPKLDDCVVLLVGDLGFRGVTVFEKDMKIINEKDGTQMKT